MLGGWEESEQRKDFRGDWKYLKVEKAFRVWD